MLVCHMGTIHLEHLGFLGSDMIIATIVMLMVYASLARICRVVLQKCYIYINYYYSTLHNETWYGQYYHTF